MGPPPFGDGKVAHSSDNAQVVLLQWGHRLSAMESRELLARLGRQHSASMGPPPFGDGKRNLGAEWRVVCAGFNGATAFRRWKGPPTISCQYRSGPLQWGHRLSAMESSVRPPILHW